MQTKHYNTMIAVQYEYDTTKQIVQYHTNRTLQYKECITIQINITKQRVQFNTNKTLQCN